MSGSRGEYIAGCSKRPSSKAAASEEARRTLRYVEPLSDGRTPLADFFSILLRGGGLFLPLREDPLHPHPYHHIRILHQWLDRIAAPVIADRLERRRGRQPGKPIA